MLSTVMVNGPLPAPVRRSDFDDSLIRLHHYVPNGTSVIEVHMYGPIGYLQKFEIDPPITLVSDLFNMIRLDAALNDKRVVNIKFNATILDPYSDELFRVFYDREILGKSGQLTATLDWADPSSDEDDSVELQGSP